MTIATSAPAVEPMLLEDDFVLPAQVHEVPRQESGELRLLAAIFDDAFRDLAKGGPHAADALRWIESDDEHPRAISFVAACAATDRDPATWRGIARRIAAGEIGLGRMIRRVGHSRHQRVLGVADRRRRA